MGGVHPAALSSHLPGHSLAHFCIQQKCNSLVFNRLCTLLHSFADTQNSTLFFSINSALSCKNTRGWACAERKQTGGGGVTRRAGRLRRNLSTTDSRNGQLFSVEKFFPKASSTLFITARLRRRFPLRTRRKASQEPGVSFSCSCAARASASGTASANFFSNSGSIAPTVLLKIKRLRMPRIASGVFEASTAISRTLLRP